MASLSKQYEEVKEEAESYKEKCQRLEEQVQKLIEDLGRRSRETTTGRNYGDAWQEKMLQEGLTRSCTFSAGKRRMRVNWGTKSLPSKFC